VPGVVGVWGVVFVSWEDLGDGKRKGNVRLWIYVICSSRRWNHAILGGLKILDGVRSSYGTYVKSRHDRSVSTRH